MSRQMYETPYQDARNYCGQCKERTFARKHLDAGDLNPITLGLLREKCSRCKQQDVGIYKADAILGVNMPSDALKRPKLPPGKGKARKTPYSPLKPSRGQIKAKQRVKECTVTPPHLFFFFTALILYMTRNDKLLHRNCIFGILNKKNRPGPPLLHLKLMQLLIQCDCYF